MMALTAPSSANWLTSMNSSAAAAADDDDINGGNNGGGGGGGGSAFVNAPTAAAAAPRFPTAVRPLHALTAAEKKAYLRQRAKHTNVLRNGVRSAVCGKHYTTPPFISR
jgi:hypothetical protein